jgi:hypothetical protein
VNQDDASAYAAISSSKNGVGKAAKKAKSYVETVQKLLDEDSRNSKIFELGIEGLVKLGSKVVGSSIDKHPYFKLHKKHLELLSSAIVATSTHANAMAAMEAAAKAADNTQAIAGQINDVLTKLRLLRTEYGLFQGPALADYAAQIQVQVSMPSSLLSLGLVGSSVPTLIAKATSVAGAIAVLLEWRARVCGIYKRSVELLAMVKIEAALASAAAAKFQQKLDKLAQGKDLMSPIANYAAQRDQGFAVLDRHNAMMAGKAKGGSTQAYTNPARFAQQNADTVAAQVMMFADFCDVALADEAPVAIGNRMAALLR